MGLRLRDDFEIRYDDPNNRTILENLNTGEQFIFNDDGTTNFTPPGITKTDEAVTFNETDVTVSGTAGIDGGSIVTSPQGWDISTASFTQSFDVSGEETNPDAITFRDDGTQMYIVGPGTRLVNEYALSTAWDISSASFTQSFDVSGQETSPFGLTFRSDGTQMYIIGSDSNSVHEYALSTAWDVSTASFTQSFDISAQETVALGLSFRDDGTQMYIVGTASDSVHEYSLSTAWDISSASFIQSFDVSGQGGIPTGVTFRSDGTQMYVSEDDSDSVNEYSLSTAWDISSASFTQSFDVSTQDSAPSGVTFKSDGTQMYVSGDANNSIYEYSTEDVTTLPSENTVSFDAPTDIESWDLATFQADADGGSVTVDVGEIVSPEFTQSFDVSTQDTVPQGVALRDDGTQMYVIGSNSDSVHEYALSTAWDISSASFTQSFDVSTQDTGPTGITFRGDGTQMYVMGGSDSTSVHEYALSTAWDISSASLTQSFDVSTQDTVPQGVNFRGDGTQMYVTGFSNASVFEYALSTAWDISSASFTQSFDVSGQETSAFGATFRADGTQMYVTGQDSDSVHEYALSTAWDISSASFTQSFSVLAQGTSPRGVTFRGDGTQMYVADSDSDVVNEYAIGAAWTLGDAFSSLVSDIARNENISSVSNTTDVDLRFTFDGTQGVDFPSVDYAARRYNR